MKNQNIGHCRAFLSAVSSLEKTKVAETPDTHIRGWKQAFTLIELLVVVLIIGILTAIAIPQYQTAVQKSRYATLMPLAKSVKNAEEAILMSNGQYSSKLEDLSITLPGTVNNNKVTNSDGTVLEVTATDSHNYVKAKKNDLNNYVMYFAKSTNFPNEIHCEALKDNKIAKQVCLSYGPTSTTPITGTDSNYDTYVLEGSGSGTGSGVSSSSTRSWADWSVASWDCSNGWSCSGYDEYGNVIVYADDCGDTYESCRSKDFYNRIYLFDENGHRLGFRACTTQNADGSCSSYEDWASDFVYGDDGMRTELHCSSVQSDGTCTGYESADTLLSVGTYEGYNNEEEYYLDQRGECSVFDATGCQQYSRLFEEESCFGGVYRECLEISGTTCLQWSDVTDNHC